MNEFTVDLSNLDADQYLENAEAIEQRLEDEEKQEAIAAQQAAAEKAQAEADANLKGNDRKLPESDPRSDGVGFNLPDVAAEFGSAVTGGLRDTASSGLTLAERAGDMISGEASQPDYDGPDWDPLGGKMNPITKTWWGNFLRGGVHYASMAAGLALAAKGAVVAGIPGAAAIAGIGGAGRAGFLARGALSGAAVDLISEYSQDDNAMGALAERFPQLDNPLATKDTDSPAMKTFKNVVEGMGIGMVADGLFMMIKKARPGSATPVDDAAGEMAASSKVRDRAADIEQQKTGAGVQQMQSADFGAYKNEPIADPWQGAPTSRAESVSDAMQQRKRLATEWGADRTGSMDSVTTPAQLTRSADIAHMPTKELDEFYNEAIGEESYARLVEQLQSRNMNPVEVLAESKVHWDGFKSMMEGRNASDIQPEEYFEMLIGAKDATQLTMVDFGKKIVLMDIMNASNTAVLRDYAIGAREIVDIADVLDTDGPMKQIVDRLRYGIEQVKTARYLWGQAGREMQTPEGAARSAEQFSMNKLRKQDEAVIRDFKQEAKSATDAMISYLKKSDNGDTTKAMLEAFSMAGGPNTLDDLYSYFVKKLKGNGFDGLSNSQLIRELQGVMVHSVLSGPKTPVRAIMGTTTATMLRPLTQALGGVMALNGAQTREGLASLNAMMQAIPEAYQLFFSRLNSYWSGELSTVKTKNFEFSKKDQEWNTIGEMMQFRKDSGGTVGAGEELAYNIANIARGANNSNLLTYSTKLMASTDDAFGFIMARARARQKAMRTALENQKIGEISEITPSVMKEYEERYMSEFLDEGGNVNFDTDAALKFTKEEATLTRDLSGFAKGLDSLAQQTPWLKPFMMFAKTGVNGLELSMKHMPLFNRLVADERRIINGTVEQAEAGELMGIGIQSADDLMQAKAIQRGRQALGTGVISMAAMHYMNGGLTGNGPQDRQQRQLWIDAGWKPRSINIGGTWVSYDSFEPFNSVLSHVADIGDHYELMGPEWTEKSLFKTALVMTQGVTSKSYLAGLQQFVDLVSMQPGQMEKMGASLINNQVPLSSLRNELGKVFNPYMKELNAGFGDSIRNRNQITEGLTSDPLPTKYDFLTGQPINNWSFPTRIFNAVSPVQFNLDYSPGKTLLFNSGYDLRASAYSTPTGVSLKDAPEVRSLYQQAMGKQGLGKKLDKLAMNPRVQASIQEMINDRNNNRYGKDPVDYHHNQVIFKLFSDVQRRAWMSIQDDPMVQKLVEADRLSKASSAATRQGKYDQGRSTYDAAQTLLNMPK